MKELVVLIILVIMYALSGCTKASPEEIPCNPPELFVHCFSDGSVIDSSWLRYNQPYGL